MHYLTIFVGTLLVSAYLGNPTHYSNHRSSRLDYLLKKLLQNDRQMDKRSYFEERVDHYEDVDEIDDEEKERTVKLLMPHVSPKKPDTYMCTAGMLLEEKEGGGYLIEFNPLADMKVAHHMLLFGCSDDEPQETTKEWLCGEMRPLCNGGTQSILYAWGRNAPSLKMPKGVGFHVGGKSSVKYLVLQVHYLNVSSFKHGHTDNSGITYTITKEKQPNHAGIYFIGDGTTPIPAHHKNFNIKMGSQYTGPIAHLFPFRFRVHAHSLSTVITGYRVRDGKWTLIGRGDPQRPQAFYKVFNDIDIQPGDSIMGECSYDSSKRNRITYIGATHNDEMCNFYIMYFYDASKASDGELMQNWVKPDNYNFPKDANLTLAAAEKAKGDDGTAYEVVENQYTEDSAWNPDTSKFGQVSGVDIADDAIIVFHRAKRVWDDKTFDLTNMIKPSFRKPIAEDTLVWLSKKTGKFIKSAGGDKFLLPHGITIGPKGNIFVTDVGAHQVFKFSPDMKLLLTLGEFARPGDGYNRFCKPTDVAVMSDGSFFVSDGYCNERVVKFKADGTVDKEMTKKLTSAHFKHIGGFHKPMHMSVVHSISLDAEHGMLYVADRENNRVLVFNAYTGDYITLINHGTFRGAVYAIAYNAYNGGVLHVVNGRGMLKPKAKVSGFTYSTGVRGVVSQWKPKQGFGMPHDIAVSDDNKEIFVAEIHPNTVWKFTKTTNNKSEN